MAASSKKKPANNRPNIGWVKTSNGKRVPKRFTINGTPAEFRQRVTALKQLWDDVCVDQQTISGPGVDLPNPNPPVWSGWAVSFAERLQKGELTITVPPVQYERPLNYAIRINMLKATYPSLHIIATGDYEIGQAELTEGMNEHVKRDYVKTGRIQTAAPFTSGELGTLHGALSDYIEWLQVEYESPEANETITDTGDGKTRMAKSFLNRFDDMPLQALDIDGIETIVQYFRNRPAKMLPNGKPSGKSMAVRSCRNAIKELFFFMRWLHRNKKYQWQLPPDAMFISRQIKETEDEVNEQAKDTPVYTIEQLTILNKYATPIERVFFLLGLNCAYGADQSTRLRVCEVDWKTHLIERVRYKKKTKSTHKLWAQTMQGLLWCKGDRTNGSTERLILKKNGESYWRKTKGGARAKDAPKLFNNLVMRVQNDFPDFPWLGFNALRDTSINLVRQHSDGELSSTHAAHKHQTDDKHLNAYSNPRIQKLFLVLDMLELKLAPVFEAAGLHPFEQPPKNYLGHKTIEQINDMLKDGKRPVEIARECRVSNATVYRYRNKLK
ncbi:hypothetical protein Pla110_21920 [Polystyrenella longa]|uniref:Resolvase HTH domain-containing protein n=1 Tax=Polystyrenella longa TaxID=2528007 RepID=A0A518CML4_9PLAN|nr:hypothetical protein [Polystyrenella longa]QDU80462.1 hypothetical protein Pla110_21920 [Polystyrenella longa]